MEFGWDSITRVYCFCKHPGCDFISNEYDSKNEAEREIEEHWQEEHENGCSND